MATRISGSRLRDGSERGRALGVVRCMVPRVFLLEVELPVGLEVTARAQRAQAQHGFSAGNGPVCAGHFAAVLDHVAARALDDAGRDRQSRREVLVVAQIPPVLDEVAGTLVDGFPPRALESA